MACEQKEPHVVVDDNGKRTHFLGEVVFSIGADAQPKEKKEKDDV